MKSLVDQLSHYADYHRDPRNIATHFVGIPMIVLSIIVLLSRPVWGDVAGVALTPALVLALLSGVYYLLLDVRLGVLMALLLALNLWLASWLGDAPTRTWLAWGIGLFVVGWVIQFIGHIYEGKKPAFFDDVMGLIMGPLFVVTECLFALGLLPHLKAAIEARSGPVRKREARAA